MEPSARIKAFIKGFELCVLKAFLPTPDDVWTIGWGRTKGVYQGMICSNAQADQWFDQDLGEKAQGVETALGGAATTQDQFDAMVSLAYNIGIAGFRRSTVLRRHRAMDHAGAAAAFLMWNKQSGKVLKGLTRRREAEQAIYRGE